jgi:hypothetical protein
MICHINLIPDIHECVFGRGYIGCDWPTALMILRKVPLPLNMGNVLALRARSIDSRELTFPVA